MQDLARFLQKMHFSQDSRKTTLAKFLQEMKVLPDCFKNFVKFAFKFTNLAKYVILTRNLQML